MVAPTNQNSDLAIDMHNVEKMYKGRVHALRGIKMQVRRGEVFGLLGPNGAGKSTLVKIMLTVVYPTKAEGTILGHKIGHKPTLARVGYLPEHHRFPKYLTGRQVLEFYAALSGVSKSERNKRADQLLETVGMTDWQHKKISQYSKGMLQRVGLAQAMMADPDLIVLDEPTDGVDPVGRREIRDVLVRLRDEGKTIFLNSHLLSELEMVCDRVAILVQGQVAQQGTLDDLTRDSQRYEIDVAGEVPDHLIKVNDSVSISPLEGNRSRVSIIGAEPEPAQPLIDALRQAGVMILSVRPMRESLEDLFIRAVHDPTTGKAFKPGAGSSGEVGKVSAVQVPPTIPTKQFPGDGKGGAA